jgi:hypothetical protein
MAKFDEVVADLRGKGFQDTEGNILNIVTR